jgi:putative oxidoreductase
MLSFMKPWQEHTYALMRIFSGFLFLWHGSQKLLGIPAAGFEPPWHLLWIAAPIEMIGGFLIMIGLFTRPAAFLASGLMAFAYWLAHGPAPFLPIQNGGEAAVLFCFVFLYVSARGAGIWSVDGPGK